MGLTEEQQLHMTEVANPRKEFDYINSAMPVTSMRAKASMPVLIANGGCLRRQWDPGV
jgi:hypothetical protein